MNLATQLPVLLLSTLVAGLPRQRQDVNVFNAETQTAQRFAESNFHCGPQRSLRLCFKVPGHLLSASGAPGIS
jgi:hypothetical protein